jgi:hypothetical protein
VTIGIGFNSSDGIVLCSDSQTGIQFLNEQAFDNSFEESLKYLIGMLRSDHQEFMIRPDWKPKRSTSHSSKDQQ